MAGETIETLLEQAKTAKMAADAALLQAQNTLEAANKLLEVASMGASAATGGVIDPTTFRLAIFVLAIFVGYYVVWSVTPALHTPLMSVTNAISSVIVVGSLLAAGAGLTMSGGTLARIFGFFALILASINIFGGFLVTERMLAMYKKKG